MNMRYLVRSGHLVCWRHLGTGGEGRRSRETLEAGEDPADPGGRHQAAALSVIRLAEIKAGDEVDFAKLQTALRKVTQTGLISNIDFEYESLPDKETDVILHLTCKDVKPLTKASIQIPMVNQDDVWKYNEAHGQPAFQ